MVQILSGVQKRFCTFLKCSGVWCFLNELSRFVIPRQKKICFYTQSLSQFHHTTMDLELFCFILSLEKPLTEIFLACRKIGVGDAASWEFKYSTPISDSTADPIMASRILLRVRIVPLKWLMLGEGLDGSIGWSLKKNNHRIGS